MRKKIIILLTLLTTGCSVNYNLVIEDETLIETTTYTQEVNNFYTKDYMNYLYKEEYPTYYDQEFKYYDPEKKEEDYTYYEKNLKDNSNSYIATYKTTYDFYDFNRAQLLHTAFENYSIDYDNEENCYYIIANNFKLFDTNEYLTDVIINIDLKKHKVVESNHDSQKGTVYTWKLDKNSNNSIIIRYKSISNDIDNNPTSNDNNQNNKTDYTIYIFFGILIAIILVGYYIFNKIKERNDNFNEDD